MVSWDCRSTVPSRSGVGVRGEISETLQAEPSVCPFSLRNKERGPQRAPAGTRILFSLSFITLVSFVLMHMLLLVTGFFSSNSQNEGTLYLLLPVHHNEGLTGLFRKLQDNLQLQDQHPRRLQPHHRHSPRHSHLHPHHQRRIPPSLNSHQVLHKTRDLTHRLELKYYAWRAIVLWVLNRFMTCL